jgi:two-component system, NtrC family, sensor kinase
LADIFGRPFGKLLTIPLQLRRKTIQDPLQVSAVLFFEHALSSVEVDHFLTFFQERLLPLGIAFDRLLLEQDLTEASLLWERTFDGLQEPVVIFDSEGQILRANKSFTENLSDVPHADLHLESLRHDDHFYEVHSYPIISGEQAHPTSIINHYVDVTISHRLQKQMIQNEKMAAIGHLAGHIAHELNNPLTGVRSLAQILVEQVPDGSTLKQDLKEVETAAERCQEIIKNLLDFSSGGFESQQVKVSLAEIVQRTLPLLKTLISRFDTDIDLSAQPDTVFVQPQLLQQVVFNIVKNAAQAMGDVGVLRVLTSFDPARNEVSLSIADSGGGIPPEIQKQIFDFFFTTKSAGQGTGLGLSMSQSIVERFNGRIELKSEVGKGSEFTIVLPYAGGRP